MYRVGFHVGEAGTESPGDWTLTKCLCVVGHYVCNPGCSSKLQHPNGRTHGAKRKALTDSACLSYLT